MKYPSPQGREHYLSPDKYYCVNFTRGAGAEPLPEREVSS